MRYRSLGNIFFRQNKSFFFAKYNCEYIYIYMYVFCLYKYVAIIFRRGKTRFRLSSIVIRSSVIFHLSRRQIIRRLPVPRGVERNAINHINQAHKLCLDTRGHTPPDFKSQEATRSSFFCLRTLCVVYIY